MSRDWGDSERNSPPSVVCSECSIVLSRRRQSVMIQWLWEASQSLLVPVAGVQMAGPDAVMTGEALRFVLANSSHGSTTKVSLWQGGGYISARVQERVLNIAVAHDARVSALESVFVLVTLGECDQTREPVVTVPRPVTPHTSGSFLERMFDRVNWQEVFESRFRAVSGFCRIAHIQCVNKQCEPLWRRGPRRSDHRTLLVVGSSSVCCRSGCSGAVQTAIECASRSCAGGWTCSAKALGKS